MRGRMRATISSVTTASFIGLFFTTLFGIALLGSALLTLVFLYHWIRYGSGVGSTLLVTVVYGLGISVILFALLGLLAQL